MYVPTKGMMKLRDYQQACVDSVLQSFEQHQSSLLVLATGLGKTVCAAHIADAYKNLGRILLLAHREELLFQGQNHLENITGCTSEIEMADQYAAKTSFFGGSDIVVSTIQTQIAGRNGGRMNRFNPQDFSLIIVDEAHHAVAPSYRKVLDYYRENENLRILGLTATPDRLDEKALGLIFGDVCYEYDISDGVRDGWLVPINQQSVVVEDLDYSTVRTTAGELNSKDLAAVLEYEEILHGMTTPILDLCGDDTTLIFTVTVEQAKRMAEIINRHKPESAFYIHGGTPKDVRRELLKKYDSGEFQYLCNVGIATEGFDCPRVSHIVMGRPTKSRAFYAQCLGRGTRTLPGVLDGLETPEARKAAIAASSKPGMTVLDFAGNAGKHQLIHPADVLGGNYNQDVIDLAQRNIEGKGKPTDIASELVQAEREWERRLREKREAEVRKSIKLKSTYKCKGINPFDLFDIVPVQERGWNQGRQPTDKQLEFLASANVIIPEGLTFTHASQLIDTVIKRRKEGLATYKMAQQCMKNGFPTDLTFKQAGIVMGALAKNKWRPLYGKRREIVYDALRKAGYDAPLG